MTVMRRYLSVYSKVQPGVDGVPPPPPDPTPDTSFEGDDDNDFLDVPTDGPTVKLYKRFARCAAMASLPDWFTNASSNYKKIIRVLGATVHWIPNRNSTEDLQEIQAGFRIFSNINKQSNMLMTSWAEVGVGGILQPVQVKAGFMMMVNNYLSEKEFDVTNDNLQVVKFYIRPWNSYCGYTIDVDFVGELELILRQE
jgi:hypothetical protein